MKPLQRITSIFLFYSLLIHMSVWVGLYLWPKAGTKKLEAPTEVEFILESAQNSSEKSVRRQIVEQDQQLNDEIPDDVQRLSAFNQRVVRETKAAKSGEFKNTDQAVGDQGQSSKSMEPSPIENVQSSRQAEQDSSPVALAQPKPRKLDLADLSPRAKPIEERIEEASRGVAGEASQTDDHLPNVATGLQTLLSSREFVYYAYYARIKERIRQYWIPTVKQKIKIVQRSGREIASSNDRITQVVVVLNRRGDLVGVQIVGPSGVHDLDQAAVEAFQAAAPFPNPPKGMVESDGFIRLRWDFVLEA